MIKVHFQHNGIYIAKETVGKINKGQLIHIVGYPYGETVECKNLNGDIETFKEEFQFTQLAVNTYSKNIMEMISEDINNKNRFTCLEHISKNVKIRGSYVLFENLLYTTKKDEYNIIISEIHKKFTDEEACNILIDEVLYGAQPRLQSQSCVGTNQKGIDKNPNYFDGRYILADNEEYTVTYCRNKIKIKKGHDGGWYSGGNTMPVIFEGVIDWSRMKKARINKAVDLSFSHNKLTVLRYPLVAEAMYNELKGLDSFKLSSEKLSSEF